jgi:hypothetical protein
VFVGTGRDAGQLHAAAIRGGRHVRHATSAAGVMRVSQKGGC